MSPSPAATLARPALMLTCAVSAQIDLLSGSRESLMQGWGVQLLSGGLVGQREAAERRPRAGDQ